MVRPHLLALFLSLITPWGSIAVAGKKAGSSRSGEGKGAPKTSERKEGEASVEPEDLTSADESSDSPEGAWSPKSAQKSKSDKQKKTQEGGATPSLYGLNYFSPTELGATKATKLESGLTYVSGTYNSISVSSSSSSGVTSKKNKSNVSGPLVNFGVLFPQKSFVLGVILSYTTQELKSDSQDSESKFAIAGSAVGGLLAWNMSKSMTLGLDYLYEDGSSRFFTPSADKIWLQSASLGLQKSFSVSYVGLKFQSRWAGSTEPRPLLRLHGGYRTKSIGNMGAAIDVRRMEYFVEDEVKDQDFVDAFLTTEKHFSQSSVTLLLGYLSPGSFIFPQTIPSLYSIFFYGQYGMRLGLEFAKALGPNSTLAFNLTADKTGAGKGDDKTEYMLYRPTLRFSSSL